MQVKGEAFVYEAEFSTEDYAENYGGLVIGYLKQYDYVFNTLKLTPPADLCEQIKTIITSPPGLEESFPTSSNLQVVDIEQNDYSLIQLKNAITNGIIGAYEKITGSTDTPFPTNLELDENQIKLPENTPAFEAFAYFDDQDCG
jgi:hypothetical protein